MLVPQARDGPAALAVEHLLVPSGRQTDADLGHHAAAKAQVDLAIRGGPIDSDHPDRADEQPAPRRAAGVRSGHEPPPLEPPEPANCTTRLIVVASTTDPKR